MGRLSDLLRDISNKYRETKEFLKSNNDICHAVSTICPHLRGEPTLYIAIEKIDDSIKWLIYMPCGYLRKSDRDHNIRVIEDHIHDICTHNEACNYYNFIYGYTSGRHFISTRNIIGNRLLRILVFNDHAEYKTYRYDDCTKLQEEIIQFDDINTQWDDMVVNNTML